MSTPAAVDVLVVGGGLAGWTAARRAQQLGRSVLVVERSLRTPGWGNSLISGGALHAALRDPVSTPPEVLLQEVLARTDGHCRPDVAAAWAHGARRAIEWIRSEGGRVEPRDDLGGGKKPPRS